MDKNLKRLGGLAGHGQVPAEPRPLTVHELKLKLQASEDKNTKLTNENEKLKEELQTTIGEHEDAARTANAELEKKEQLNQALQTVLAAKFLNVNKSTRLSKQRMAWKCAQQTVFQWLSIIACVAGAVMTDVPTNPHVWVLYTLGVILGLLSTSLGWGDFQEFVLNN